MSARPAVRFATGRDTPAIVAMLRESLGPRMTEELWRWKHLDNPFGPSPVLLAEAGDEIVAVRAFMRWNWKSGSRTIPAVRAVDTATHRNWRRRGLFAELTERLAEHCTEEGIVFVFNTPNRFSRPGYLKLGWSRVARTPLRVWPRLGGVLAHAVQPARGTEESSGSGPRMFPPVCELLARPEVEALSAGEPVGSDRYRTPRSREYLSWRYGVASGRTYRAAWHFREGRGAAVVFHTRLRGRFRVAMISEILSTDRESARRPGSRLVRTVAEDSRADLAVAVAPSGSLDAEALTSARLLPIPGAGPQLTTRPLAWTAGLPDPKIWRSWSCSLGDLELF